MTHNEFFFPLLKKFGADKDHPISKYLYRKTAAVDRGSKARRSLGNLYALKVLAEDLISGYSEGTQFTLLLNRMRSLPFGSKLQNHPLDNRLNDEFSRCTGLGAPFLPVQQGNSSHGRTRKISMELLTYEDSNPNQVAEFIVEVVSSFSNIICSGQEEFVERVEGLNTSSEIKDFVEEALNEKSDARLFEVVSYCILKYYYAAVSVSLTLNGKTDNVNLQLFKTGRTNANDGGIDFVLKPLGRFFQVTETLDFKKYFLDFEKLNRVPITFVIKTNSDSNEVFKKISDKSAKEIPADLHSIYLSLFEEIITSDNLREYLNVILKDGKKAKLFLKDLVVNFRVEYGHFD